MHGVHGAVRLLTGTARRPLAHTLNLHKIKTEILREAQHPRCNDREVIL